MDYTFNQFVGRKNIVADTPGTLGDTGLLDDIDRGPTGPGLRMSSMPITARIVKGNGVLSPGVRVIYTSGLFGIEVEIAGAEAAHGIVDPNLKNDTATDDTFLIFIEGPMDVIASGAVDINEQVEGDSDGKVAALDSGIVEGRAIEAAVYDGDVIRAYMSFPQF